MITKEEPKDKKNELKTLITLKSILDECTVRNKHLIKMLFFFFFFKTYLFLYHFFLVRILLFCLWLFLEFFFFSAHATKTSQNWIGIEGFFFPFFFLFFFFST